MLTPTQNFFLSALNGLYCRAFSIKTKYVSENFKTNRWMSPELKSIINSKSDYFHLYRTKMISLVEFNRFKNRCTNIIRRHKKLFYKQLFSNSMNDIKKTWNNINELLSKGVKSCNINKIVKNGIEFNDDLDIASIFNEYFCSIGSHLDSNIPLIYC